MAFKDLNKSLIMAMDNTIIYVINSGNLLHLDTVKARNYLIIENNMEWGIMKKRFFKSFFIAFLIFAIIYGGAVYFLVSADDESDTDSTFFDDVSDDKNKELTFLLLGIDTKDITKY